MINLLPPATKQNFEYARRNTRLLRWITRFGLAIAGIAVVVLSGLMYMNRSITALNSQIALSQEQLKTAKLEETQKKVEDMTGSLKLVVTVLSKEILFSKMIQKIGGAMPPNTVLTALSINKVQGGIDLQAQATDYTTASRIQVNLSDPKNQIFTKADINSITCTKDTTSSALDTKYPCKVAIRAEFGTNSQFYFINNSVKAGS